MSDRPLKALGLAAEAELGNEMWKLHQQWLYEDSADCAEEVIASQAALGRQVNQLLLGWMNRVLAREGVRSEQRDTVMTLAPTLQMTGDRVA